MNNIEFIGSEQKNNSITLKPVPAKIEMPKWYKTLPGLRKFYNKNNPEEKPDITAKKCIPILDALTTGYYLVTEYDSYWSVNENGEHEVVCDGKLVEGGTKPITMHPFEQIRGIELGGVYNEYAYKFVSPWVIKTPPGYSCIFTHPFNQVSPFLTLTGVVDTDMHPLAIQFPFLMIKNFEGVIKKNTPIVQIIPYQREDWTHSIPKVNNLHIQESSKGMTEFDQSRYDNDGNAIGGEYKKKYRKPKRYL